jgi:hypothetical protein
MVRIGHLKAQLERCWIVWHSLECDLNRTHLTPEERAAILNHQEDLWKEGHALQLAVELLERQEHDERERGTA